ncbi:PREDICTED: SAM pointed domain-containing Ets transcription factor-like [Branchiostoma belcheri]|uniref:SAM pointed domain-containing Ets transcription factor-like n=1 Tax=Branchiostoma belcheri TaxID=7741 RepID=A0A6P5AAS3_BRABE|nr:PREDICTED: SAM pointed domain-containing Ets transcription factor-like [Branchiostoma belcheri]
MRRSDAHKPRDRHITGMETEKLSSSSKHMSLPEVGVFLTPPSTPASPAANSPPPRVPTGKPSRALPAGLRQPDPGQTFDFPAPFAVPLHEASPGAALRHHREAMGIPPPPVTGPKPPPPHPGDLSEQQLDRFLRQTRREFSDLLSGPDEPPPAAAERRQTVVSHHHLPGLDRPPSPPRQHHPLPGMDRPPSPPRQQPGLTDRDLEEVQTLIMQEVSRDIEVAFKVVQVPRDPRTWSPTDVARWLRWTADQYRLPNVYLECFPLDGAQLCDLAEREFVYRAPESGQILYALLDIWKSGITNGPGSRSTVCTINKKPMSFPNPYMPNCAPYPALQDTSPPQTEKAVHLWQFLRELLSQPEAYSRFIRWMDRGKGIFKIEDSVQVARLWGIRKSRPAMNYDKLSRSIRQYYKKGIIRKPDQAQRLVYQFVKN